MADSGQARGGTPPTACRPDPDGPIVQNEPNSRRPGLGLGAGVPLSPLWSPGQLRETNPIPAAGEKRQVLCGDEVMVDRTFYKPRRNKANFSIANCGLATDLRRDNRLCKTNPIPGYARGTRPGGRRTRGNRAKQSQTWAGWDTWGKVHQGANCAKQSQFSDRDRLPHHSSPCHLRKTNPIPVAGWFCARRNIKDNALRRHYKHRADHAKQTQSPADRISHHSTILSFHHSSRSVCSTHPAQDHGNVEGRTIPTRVNAVLQTAWTHGDDCANNDGLVGRFPSSLEAG
jgi:hypothetical protein